MNSPETAAEQSQSSPCVRSSATPAHVAATHFRRIHDLLSAGKPYPQDLAAGIRIEARHACLSAQGYPALWGADAWITWPNWPATNPDVLEMVELSQDRVIWRDLSVALAPAADPEAQAFLDYLLTDKAKALMATEGWVR